MNTFSRYEFGPFFDELLASTGTPRAGSDSLLKALDELGLPEIRRRQKGVRAGPRRTGRGQ